MRDEDGCEGCGKTADGLAGCPVCRCLECETCRGFCETATWVGRDHPDDLDWSA